MSVKSLKIKINDMKKKIEKIDNWWLEPFDKREYEIELKRKMYMAKLKAQEEELERLEDDFWSGCETLPDDFDFFGGEEEKIIPSKKK